MLLRHTHTHTHRHFHYAFSSSRSISLPLSVCVSLCARFMWRCGHRDVTWSRMLYGFVNLAQTMRCSYWCIGLSAAIGIQNIGNHRHLVHGRSCWAHLRRSARRGWTHIVYYTSVDLAVELLRYDTRCYFNVRSKADISQLNLPHGTDN